MKGTIYLFNNITFYILMLIKPAKEDLSNLVLAVNYELQKV